MKTKLSITCMMLLALCLSCDKDTPLAPETETISPPDLFPLAEGAKWEYQYEYRYYEYYYYYPSPPINIDEHLTGKYTLSVKEQQIFEDSIVYTLSAVTEPDIGSGGGEESWEVMLHSDTLWYKQDSTWAYMMPASFQDDGYIDISLFLPPIGRRYDLVKGPIIPSGTEFKDIGLYSYDNAGNGLLAEIKSKGVEKIDIFWTSGSMNMHPQWMRKKVWLADYTPGMP